MQLDATRSSSSTRRSPDDDALTLLLLMACPHSEDDELPVPVVELPPAGVELVEDESNMRRQRRLRWFGVSSSSLSRFVPSRSIRISSTLLPGG